MTETAERDTVQEQLCARIDELEREKEVLAAQLDRAETDRDEWKAQADGEAMVCSGYRDELDALKAHSKRQAKVIFDTLAAVEDGDVDAVPWDEARALYNEAPAASLARRYLLKQAEALESLWPRLVTKADQQITRHHARELRRQAEKGGDNA